MLECFVDWAKDQVRQQAIRIGRTTVSGSAPGGWERLVHIALDTDDEGLIALDDALAQLAVEDPEAARLVNLRFFAGLTLRDAAVFLGLSQRTAQRQWTYARAWLYARLRQDAGPTAL
jgi:DNA-directed RNA polymerase specialized sigma24 family protein